MINHLLSLARLRCPHCHKGKLFVDPNPYKLHRIHLMPKHCACCHQAFEPEQGFYYGAMYVSYALTVALFVTFWVGFMVMLEMNPVRVLIAYVAFVILFFPYVFRYGRAIYLYFFVRYDKNAQCQPDA
jgi:hypothetical protein